MKIIEYTSVNNKVYILNTEKQSGLYFFTTNGALPAKLQGLFTSRNFADKAWKQYCKSDMKFPRTAKNLKDFGEPDSKDFKLLKGKEIKE